MRWKVVIMRRTSISSHHSDKALWVQSLETQAVSQLRTHVLQRLNLRKYRPNAYWGHWYGQTCRIYWMTTTASNSVFAKFVIVHVTRNATSACRECGSGREARPMVSFSSAGWGPMAIVTSCLHFGAPYSSSSGQVERHSCHGVYSWRRKVTIPENYFNWM